MASAIYFGRAGLPTASGGDGLTLYRGDWEAEGDKSTVELVIQNVTAADAKALRDQLLGYDLNTDEPVIPIVDNADSSRSGFYRVQRIRQRPEEAFRETGSKLTYKVTAELLRVPGWQAPLFEEIANGGLRVNSHSVVIGTTIPLAVPPSGAFAVDSEFLVGTSVTSADGALTAYTKSSPTTYGLDFSFAVAAADFYKGSCRALSSSDSGSTYRTIVGRQVGQTPTYIRASNGLVEWTTTATASKTELSVRWYDGSQWETAKVFRFTQDTSYTDLARAPVAVTVLRNAPECVSIRLGLGGSGAITSVTLDLTIVRGSRVIYGLLNAPTTSPSTDYGVELGTAETATDITGGIRATNDDAGGNKVVIATPKAITDTDNTNGALRISGQTFPFALACAIGGTVGNGFNETQGLVYEYLAALNRRQAIVAR